MWILGRTPGALGTQAKSAKLEWDAAQRAGWQLALHRNQVPENTFCVPRYSTVPLLHEFFLDIQARGVTTINDKLATEWCRYIQDWSIEYNDVTPKTSQDVGRLKFPICVRGTAKSAKSSFNERMFIPTPADVYQITRNFCDSVEYAQLPEYTYREWEEFQKIPIDEPLIGYPPVINEWRTFWAYGEHICTQFYWEPLLEVYELRALKDLEAWRAEATAFSADLVKRSRANFVCLDVGKRADGVWRLIEVNDGQSAGLQGYDPDSFYKRLLDIVTARR